MVGGMVGLIARRSLLCLTPVLAANQLMAVALMVWARITFGWRSYHFAANPTEGGLVTWGPYRYIRHPIYTSVCWFVGAAFIGHWSGWNAALGALAVLGALVRIFCEEALIPTRYPEYKEYAARTWRMIPWIF